MTHALPVLPELHILAGPGHSAASNYAHGHYIITCADALNPLWKDSVHSSFGASGEPTERASSRYRFKATVQVARAFSTIPGYDAPRCGDRNSLA